MLNLNQIYQGDCLEIMKGIDDKSVDMILADLPYNTTDIYWDRKISLESLWEHYKRIIKDNGSIILTAMQPFTSKLVMSNPGMFRYNWIWESNKAANFAQAPYMPLKNTEDVLVFSYATIAANSKNRMKYKPQGTKEVNKICKGRGATNHRPNRSEQGYYKQTRTNYPKQILKFNKVKKPLHPTQKPVALFEYLIKTYTNEGDVVLDNVAGSGTTGVACQNLNRNFILIEKEPEYCEIAKQRLSEQQNQKSLLELAE